MRLLVIGDVMLDRYTFVTHAGDSQESGTPILERFKEVVAPGGAANAAYLALTLDAEVELVGTVGNDPAGITLQLLLADISRLELSLSGSVAATVVKERIWIFDPTNDQYSEHCRIDHNRDLARPLHESEMGALESKIVRADALLVSDYYHNTLSPYMLNFILGCARRHRVRSTVNGKPEHFEFYKEADTIIMNESEWEPLENVRPPSGDRTYINTRGSGPVVMMQAGAAFVAEPVKTKPVNVCGAGDMFSAAIAVFGQQPTADMFYETVQFCTGFVSEPRPIPDGELPRLHNIIQ